MPTISVKGIFNKIRVANPESTPMDKKALAYSSAIEVSETTLDEVGISKCSAMNTLEVAELRVIVWDGSPDLIIIIPIKNFKQQRATSFLVESVALCNLLTDLKDRLIKLSKQGV
jgi:hypothetical protein